MEMLASFIMFRLRGEEPIGGSLGAGGARAAEQGATPGEWGNETRMMRSSLHMAYRPL